MKLKPNKIEIITLPCHGITLKTVANCTSISILNIHSKGLYHVN